jgi:hypothetical protein
MRRQPDIDGAVVASPARASDGGAEGSVRTSGDSPSIISSCGRTQRSSVTPRTSSMVKNHCPPSSISSPSATRLGCEIPCSARNSFLNRNSVSGASVRSVLSATAVRRSLSNASHTTPMPPSPRRRRKTKRGVPWNSRGSADDDGTARLSPRRR